MKHANAYVVQLIALYQLALAEYIKVNKDTLDKIQAKMKDTVLCGLTLRMGRWGREDEGSIPWGMLFWCKVLLNSMLFLQKLLYLF